MFVYSVVELVLVLLLLFWLLSLSSTSAFAVYDEKSFPSSNSVELKSVSVVSFIRFSDC